MAVPMAPFEKVKEIIEHTIDDKKLDEKLVLQQTKEELLKLNEDVTYATEVLAELKKFGQIDEQKFQSLDTKLGVPEKRKEALQEIANVIDTISSRYETMQAEEKEKVKTMTETLKNSKQSLSGLKEEVLQKGNIDYTKIEAELADEAAKKLEEHWYTKPFAAGYRKHIHEKVEELKNGKKEADGNRWQKVKSGIGDWFYGILGTMFVGKKLVDALQDKLGTYKDKIVDGGKKIADATKSGIETMKDVISSAPKTAEQLKEDETKARKYIKAATKKYAHKELTEEQIDRVAKRINLSQQLKDGTSEWSKIINGNEGNYLDASVETLTMPLEMFATLASALDAEGIIDIKQLGFNVVGNTVEYGLKGFKLFGVGLAVVAGKMDLKELNGHISHLYEKSPLAAKQLLFALIYRTSDGPLMRMVTNAGAFLTKTLTWPLFESRGDVGFVKNALQDSMKGNMNTALKQMKETNGLIQKLGVQDNFLGELIDEIDGAVQKSTTYNNILGEAQGLKDSPSFIKDLQAKFKAGSPEYKFLTAHSGSKEQFLNKLGTKRMQDTQIMQGTMKSFSGRRGIQFKNRGAKMLVGDNATRHILVDFAHNIEAQGKAARNMLASRNMFDQMANKLYLNRTRAIGQVMHGSEILDKAVWKFKDVNELADFTENAKMLARKSPATAKFLLGKAPILIVGGLALSEGDTVDEKMQGLLTGLQGLIPLVGPVLIMRDGLWTGESTNRGQAALGAALLGVDGVRLCKGIIAKDATKVVHMFTQPVVDMIEIGKFMSQSGVNTIKMVRDGAKLVREGKMAGVREKLLASFKGAPKKKWAVAAAVVAFIGYEIYDSMPEGMDKEAEVMFAKYKNDPNGLDRALAENWPTFDQDTKNECLKYALIAKFGLSAAHADKLTVDHKDATYTISIPVMVEKQYGNALLASLEDNIALIEPQAKIQMEVKGATALSYRKLLEEQLKSEGETAENIPSIVDQQLEAMGYNPTIGKEKA